MTFRDLVSLSLGNLWRMKLRSSLTIAGVVIAIAAFVSMVSFGAGNQQLVTEQFNELGLLSTMHVFPLDEKDTNDSIRAAVLDQSAVEILANVPGVNLAYPLDAFGVKATLGDTQVDTKAQALPGAAVHTKVFSQLLAGSAFGNDSTHEALISSDFLELVGIEDPDSVIGRQLVVSVELAVIDSGLTNVLKSIGDRVGERVKNFNLDSLRSQDYRQRVIREEATGAMTRFVDGFMNNRALVSDTLTICGVLKGKREHNHRVRTESIIVPIATATRFNSGGISGDPASMMLAVGSGKLSLTDEAGSGKSYPRVTLDLDPSAPYQPVKDSVEALGFKTFSFAEQFDKIRQFFFYFDLALGLIGLIALVTASLGIVNTMVMSILERKREIGVLKSLGADEREIRFLFLVESGAIGTIGATAGIIFGWLITRVASSIAKAFMERESVDPVELFAMPLWLILTALLFGLIVSVIAGFYPASRAARIDPVEALRNE